MIDMPYREQSTARSDSDAVFIEKRAAREGSASSSKPPSSPAPRLSRTRTFQPHPRHTKRSSAWLPSSSLSSLPFAAALLRTAVLSPSTCVRTADVQMINLFGNNGARNTPFAEFRTLTITILSARRGEHVAPRLREQALRELSGERKVTFRQAEHRDAGA